MKEPLIFFLSRTEIAQMQIKLPGGKELVLKRGQEYKAVDPEEIEFLTGVKGLGARKMKDKDFRGWATTKFEDLPHIERPDIRTIEDVEEHLWTPAFEKVIVSFLNGKGYDISKAKTVEDKPSAPKPKTATKKKSAPKKSAK